MSFKALFLKEHVSDDEEKIDTQVIILYDPAVNTFFYYGTRNPTNKNSHVNYQGEFHYSRIYSFVTMLKYTFNRFSEVITHELHDIFIDPEEYDSLDFNYLVSKISRKTEMAAYDKSQVSKELMSNLLDMLISHEI